MTVSDRLRRARSRFLGTLPPLAAALTVGDFDDDGIDDHAVGLPFEAVGATPSAEAVNVLYSAGLFRDGFEAGDETAWSSAVGN